MHKENKGEVTGKWWGVVSRPSGGEKLAQVVPRLQTFLAAALVGKMGPDCLGQRQRSTPVVPTACQLHQGAPDAGRGTGCWRDPRDALFTGVSAGDSQTTKQREVLHAHP